MTVSIRNNLRLIISLFFLLLHLWLLLFSSYLVSVEIKSGNFSILTTSLFLLITATFFIKLRYFILNNSTVSASNLNRIITIQNLISQKGRTYEFKELDGYVTGRIRNRDRGSYITYKVIWIVKDNKMIERIDERYIVNYNELEKELKEMKYLGYQKIRLWKRFKMLFGPISIE